jgi:3-hydroxyacyl-[acyl-carrier-protein] dehydratase
MTGAARATAWRVPLEHPAFAGHFPGHPIVPGALLLAEALAAAQAASATTALDWIVASAKFTSPVAPGTELVIVLSPGEGAALAVEMRAGERVVARVALVRRDSRTPAS